MHIPVLQREVLEYLNPNTNENFIDCTLGEGGHTLAILEKNGPKGKILGIDADPNQIKNCSLKIKNKKRITLIADNFSNLKETVKRAKFGPVDGILFDLGLSSWHLEQSGRGFSFLRKEPLDMRYCQENHLTAEKIINYWSVAEIEKIIRDYGQERFAAQIAKNIINFRQVEPIKTTFQLVEVIKKSIPVYAKKRKIHPATKTFQALRIAVNNELDNLQKALPQAVEILRKGGRVVVISFHSLEDWIVKNFYKEMFKKGLLKILTKKPIVPQKEEIKINPRSRSAKLRAAIKTTAN